MSPVMAPPQSSFLLPSCSGLLDMCWRPCNEAEKNQLSQGDVAGTGQWPWSGRCQPRNRTEMVILINPVTGSNRQLHTPLTSTLAKSQGFFEGTGMVGRSMSLGVRTLNLRSQFATLQVMLFGPLASLNWYHFHGGGIIAVPCWRVGIIKAWSSVVIELDHLMLPVEKLRLKAVVCMRFVPLVEVWPLIWYWEYWNLNRQDLERNTEIIAFGLG